MSGSPRIGTAAPDFDLPAVTADGVGRERLADHRGRWVAIVFYPRDFSLVCPTELTAVSSRLDEFDKLSCDVVGISVDDPETHARWLETPRAEGGLGGLAFPLLADEDGAAATAYGVFLEELGVAARGLFLIDPEGVLQYAVIQNLSVGRGTDETLRVIAALQSGGMCGADWTREKGGADPVEGIGPGSRLSKYRVTEQIGEGGFARVFRADDLQLQRTVAVKVLRLRKAEQMQAVLDEARAAAALLHPNIATIFAVDDSEGVPLIAMEYVPGETLTARIKAGMEESAARSVLAQVASALAAAHGAGVVHADLKPGNVLVTDEGLAKVLDFGLARRGAPPLDADRPTSVSGTPQYMAPELFIGEPASERSDVFAFGALLYEVFARKRAFSGKSVTEILTRVRTAERPLLAIALPERYRDLLVRTLAPQADERTVTMAELAAALSA